MARVAAILLVAALALAAAPSARCQGLYYPKGGGGNWQDGGYTDAIMVYSNLMKDGTVVGWANGYTEHPRFKNWITVDFNPNTRERRRILPGCGMHGAVNGECTTAFCSGTVTTAGNELFAFGGHRGSGLGTFKRYNHNRRTMKTYGLPSKRWYPTPVTMPDGRIMVVGGSRASAKTECGAPANYNNPSYFILDPKLEQYTGDKGGMFRQLTRAWPHVAYPVVTVLPDGGIAVAAGATVSKYQRCGPNDVCETFAYSDMPRTPFTYPATGIGMVLPLSPPYTKQELLITGGSRERCPQNFNTPASNQAHLIDLMAGRRARWVNVGPMPYPRMMGDATYLCDGTILFMNGARRGRAGWCKGPITYRFKRNSRHEPYDCKDFCTCALDELYAPTIFNPATRKWTRAGTLAEQTSMRLYHSTAILLPNCKVMIAGSDATMADFAETYAPPYFNLGAQPRILAAPADVDMGTTVNITITYSSKDPVDKALLIRTATQTHSSLFDGRAVYLRIVKKVLRANGRHQMIIQLPGCNYKTPPVGCNITPPGMYMLTLTSRKGVPSGAAIMSLWGRGMR